MIQRGVSFGDIHSFHDLNLILSEYEISPAEPKTSYIDIPGGDGSLDLTEAHGEVKYSDRDITFTFTVSPYDITPIEEKKTQIANALNGLRCKITLDKDAEYYYLGRVTVDKHQRDKKIKKITISARVAPYKYKQDVTEVSVSLTESASLLSLYNGRKTVIPVVECTGSATIVFRDLTFSVGTGSQRVLNFYLTEGENQMLVSGNGTLTISYQEGEL